MSRRAARRVALLLTALLALLLLPATAAHATTDESRPEPSRPWFGPELDWSRDLPRDYADRLGRSPSMYGQHVDYPLDEQSRTFLRQFVEQAATQGAVAALTLEPWQGLDGLTPEDARDLAEELATLHRQYDTRFLVRFAPEMNGSWKAWGQQPSAYVEAFSVVADAVHDTTPEAEMVWSPVYGAGYPYGAAYGDLAPGSDREVAELDTNDDGLVDQRDDPYGPYFPGYDHVDWVGITLYHFGDERGRIDNELDVDARGEPQEVDPDSIGFATNQLPPPSAVADRWEETHDYVGDIGRESFYDRFAEPADAPALPLLLDTAALWQPGEPGEDELDIKREWWQQVLASLEDRPQVAGVLWLEQRRPEAEADDRVVDWRATRSDTLAAPFLQALLDAEVVLGPVTRVLDQEVANEESVQGRLPDVTLAASELDWIVLCAVVLAAAFCLALLVGRLVPSWRYVDTDDGRDHRLDLLRGFIILAVVITHVEVAGPYSYLTLNAIGAITGAELFVLLSGLVLGMVYAPTIRRLGEWGAAVTMLRRARKLYLVALAVVVLVWVLGKVPGLDTSAIATFTDRGTGSAGAGAAGTVYDLYLSAERWLDYPPPQYAIEALLLLEVGPWVFNIMGLFVVLSAVLPLLMVLVRRGLWWLLLALSWAAYVVGTVTGAQLLPSQFEDVFPLLIWQLPFVHGLVLGHYRRQVLRALTRRTGAIVVGVLVVGYAAALGWLWLSHTHGVPGPFPAGTWDLLAERGYTRVVLQPGRLVDLPFFLAVSYVVLTFCWVPISRAISWLWTPLGRSSLYVFIVHVFFVLAVANVPGLDRESVWQGTLVHTVVILAIWGMVKRRVLFGVIPR